MRRTNVLSLTDVITEETTADRRASVRPNRTNVLTEEATADPRERADRRASERPMATARGSAERIV